MKRKIISNTDLNFLIVEELKKTPELRSDVGIAIIPMDVKELDGFQRNWSVVMNRKELRANPLTAQRIDKIATALGKIYKLKAD